MYAKYDIYEDEFLELYLQFINTVYLSWIHTKVWEMMKELLKTFGY